ncbi:MAG: response regulator [Bacteroidetes bacterium]|nr:response regulator [Bacteroidota bacterium]
MQPIQSVFLIDDELIVNMINEKIIKNSNSSIEVTKFSDAKVALAQLIHIIETDPDQFPDVIFLDINMPGMNGWEFLDQYANFPPSILAVSNVYMLTSSIDSTDIEHSKEYTAVVDFISKPLSAAWLEIITSRVNTIF